MIVHELSRTDARRIAVRAQLLDGAAGLTTALERTGPCSSCGAMIRPSDDLALYRAEMAQWPGRGELAYWLAHQRDEALRIRDERRLRALGIARARGPECAGRTRGRGRGR